VSSIRAGASLGRVRDVSSAPPVHVVALTEAGTREAVATAAALAQTLDARVHVIAAQAIPSESGLDRQSLSMRTFTKTIREVLEHSPVPMDVLPCLCKRLIDVMQLLPDHATVIVAGPSRRWWPTREQRLAHDLAALGYRVIFVHSAA
jgi:hypothetical protein